MRTGERLPAVGDVLASLATGMWHWDTATDLVSVDAEAARLLGLPPEKTTLTEAQVRARLHPVDWNEITGVVQLAAAEDSLAEVRIRIMDEHNRIIRVVRSRSKPAFDARKRAYKLIGTLQEVAEPTPGSPRGDARSPATGGAPGRPSCSTPAGRWPRPAPRPRCCGWRRACRCRGSRRTAWRSSASRATA